MVIFFYLLFNNFITLTKPSLQNISIKILKNGNDFYFNFLYVCATFLIQVQSFDIQMGL